MAHLTTYLDLESHKILRSGFDFKLNLTSAIGDLANRGFLASYVSHHKAMAYDTRTVLGLVHWPKPRLPWSSAKPSQKLSWKIFWKQPSRKFSRPHSLEPLEGPEQPLSASLLHAALHKPHSCPTRGKRSTMAITSATIQ